MFDALRHFTLRLLRVPAEPQPPAGAPGSVRVFRAGARYFHLKMIGWAVAQVFALGGALVSLWFVGWAIDTSRQLKRDEAAAATAIRPAPPPVRAEAMDGPNGTLFPDEPAARPTPKTKAKSSRGNRSALRQMALRTPEWMLVTIQVLEYGAVVLFVLQAAWTFAALRLDYEMRWYVVTDRSLRLRRGLLTVHESTLSFVNIQQVVVTQGPLQRLLGLGDVRVQSAGGGGDAHGEASGGDNLHTAVFHAVDNAHEIRDLIQARLREFRAAGLGDPDEAAPQDGATADASGSAPVLAAARELLEETRALRRAL